MKSNRRIKYTIVGMKKIMYWGETISGHNCRFKTKPEQLEKFIVCLMDNKQQRYELELWEDYRECSSGWTTASYGYYNLKEVQFFGAFTHVPKKEYNPTIKFKEADYFECGWFMYSENGGDEYYPSGYVKIAMKRFKSTGRGFDLVPTWVFYGNPDIKKVLGCKLKSFYADNQKMLPKKIMSNIVFAGTKYPLKDIVSRIDGTVIYAKCSSMTGKQRKISDEEHFDEEFPGEKEKEKEKEEEGETFDSDDESSDEEECFKREEEFSKEEFHEEKAVEEESHEEKADEEEGETFIEEEGETFNDDDSDVEYSNNECFNGGYESATLIFYGASNLGKSYIAHEGYNSVYETDCHQKLPEDITANIVVIGNKFKHSLKDIKDRIKGRTICIHFSDTIETGLKRIIPLHDTIIHCVI